MNNIQIIGTITRDIELKETSNQVKYTRFSIAVNRKFANQNGEYGTDFFNVVAWRKTAEFIANYFGKGKRIAISGNLQTNIYTDRDGNERTSTEIVANEVFFIDKKEENKDTPANAEPEKTEDVYADFGDSIEINDDDISF